MTAASGNIVAPTVISVVSAGLALIVPVPVVFGLFLARSGLGVDGYGTLALALFIGILIPGICGSILAGTLFQPGASGGRRPFAIVVVVAGVVIAGAVAATAVATAKAHASSSIPWSVGFWLVIFAISVLWFGAAQGRRDADVERALPGPLEAGDEWELPTTSMRMLIFVALGLFAGTAAVFFGLSIVPIVTTHAAGPRTAEFLIDDVKLGLIISLIVSSFPFFLASARYSKRIKPLFRGDYRTQRRITRAVMRANDTTLSAAESIAASRYASLWAASAPLQTVGSVLLFGGLGVEFLYFVSSSVRGAQLPFIVEAGMIVVAAPLSIVLGIRRTRRARAYVRAHPLMQPEPRS